MSTSSSIVPSSVAGESSISGGFQYRQASILELEKKVRSQQDTIFGLESKIRKLEEELANAKMRLVNKKGPVDLSDCSAEMQLKKDLQRIGKYHGVFSHISVSSEWFGKPQPSFKPSDSKERYSSTGNMLLGNVAELYSSFPAKYHSILANPDMEVAISAFTKGLSEGRSTALNKIRNAAPSIFPTIPSNLFLSSTFDGADCENLQQSAENSANTMQLLSEHPEVQHLLGAKRVYIEVTQVWKLAYLNSTLETFPPVLFMDGETNNALKLFKSSYVIKIAKIIIAGPKALKTQVMPRLREDSPLIHIDKRVNHTTPGLIAWSSVATIYTLSDDIEFTGNGVGGKTGRNYLALYETFKRYLITNYTSLSSLFSFWNAVIFPHSQPLEESQRRLASQPTWIVDSESGETQLNSPEDLVQQMTAIFKEQSLQEELAAHSVGQGQHRGNQCTNADTQHSDHENDTDEFTPPSHSIRQSTYFAVTNNLGSSEDDEEPHIPHARPSRVALNQAPLTSATSAATPVIRHQASHQPVNTPAETAMPVSIPAPSIKSKGGKKKSATPVQSEDTVVPARARTTRSGTRKNKAI